MNKEINQKIEILQWLFHNLNFTQLMKLKSIAIDLKDGNGPSSEKGV